MEELIYIQLLKEGVEVYRPVSAYKLKDNVYKIQGRDIYDPDNEQWEFLPDTYVYVENRTLSEGDVLVAIKKYDEV